MSDWEDPRNEPESQGRPQDAIDRAQEEPMPRRKTTLAAVPAAPAAPAEAAAAPETAPEGPAPMTEKPEPTAAEWAARREALLAKVPKKEDRPTQLYGKLAQILGLIPTVEKRGVNDFHRYNYAKESDLVEAVRPLLSEYGIFPWWTVLEHERRGQVKTKGENAGIEVETLSVIHVQFKFFDGATGQCTEPQTVVAYGDDPGDKGIYKALTGAIKYALMKTFQIATGDDPEADKATDRRSAAYESRNVTVQRSGRAPAAPGGRQTEASKPQERKLSDLLKEAGVRESAEAAVLIGRIMGVEVPLGEDKAGSLAAFLNGLDPQVKGKLIFDLRKGLEDGSIIKPEQPAEKAAAGGQDEGAPLEAGSAI